MLSGAMDRVRQGAAWLGGGNEWMQVKPRPADFYKKSKPNYRSNVSYLSAKQHGVCVVVIILFFSLPFLHL